MFDITVEKPEGPLTKVELKMQKPRLMPLIRLSSGDELVKLQSLEICFLK